MSKVINMSKIKGEDVEYGTIRAKVIAFFIDILIVYVFRSLYLNICARFYLKDGFESLVSQFREKYGEVKAINREQILFLMEHPFAQKFLYFVWGAFFISVVYNYICFLWKNASIGQRCMGLHIIDNKFNTPSKWLLLARAFTVIVPWFAMFLIFLQMFLSNFQVVYVNSFFFTTCLIISLLWHDVVFFNNKKLLGHDFLTNTRVVFDDPNRDETFAERVIPNPSRAWEKLKAWYYKSMQEIKSLKETNKK